MAGLLFDALLSDVKKLYQIGALSATKYLNYYELFQTIKLLQPTLIPHRNALL